MIRSLRHRLRDELARLGRRLRGPPVPPESLLLERWRGQQPAPRPGGRLCLFAHFDRDGRVDEHVLRYLEELAALGASTIFVSASEDLQEEEVRRVLPLCFLATNRRNLGHDFGSWRLGLALAGDALAGDALAAGQLILANDSVYGPLRPLSEVFAEMAPRRLDLWSATSSLETAWHLQSYFLVFEPGALRSPFFSEFWESFEFLTAKAAIIRRYEVGITRAARRHGLELGALVEAEQLAERVRRHHPDHQFADRPLARRNPTLHYWDVLVGDFGFPFLKTELLRTNLVGSQAARRWEERLPEAHAAVIRRHLARVRRPGRPPRAPA